VFDRQRLADIIRNNSAGDLRDLADEVVRLMGLTVDTDDDLRATRTERDLWKSEARKAKKDSGNLAAGMSAVLAAVPKTKRAQFAEVEQLVADTS